MADQIERKNGTKSYTDEPGKFAPGNPGKPKGARHKTTLAIESILEGEGEALTEKAIALALEGDTTALRLCLERIAPPRKDRPIVLELPPMETADDLSVGAQGVLRAVSEGVVTRLEGAAVMSLIESYRKTFETVELERRILELEKAR